MNFRKILSIATFALVAILVFASREDFVQVFQNLGQLNIWILALLVPVQILMYFAAGQIYFSYLKAKKQLINVSTWNLMRVSLEINFVNHIIPSGGVSGLSYLAWRLKDFGITAGQAAMMQVVRYGLVALATTVIILVATVVLGFSGVNLGVLVFSAMVALGLAAVVLLVVFIIGHEKRVRALGRVVRKVVNAVVKFLTFKKVPELLKQKTVNKFLLDLHRDYRKIIKDKKLLARPFMWSVLYSLLDSGTFLVAFYALGNPVSFAPVVIAQGIASIVGTVVVTPGGAGFFEAVMASYYIATGVEPSIAITATLITRVAVLLGTIVSGWGFYQMALLKSKDKNLEVGGESGAKPKSKRK